VISSSAVDLGTDNVRFVLDQHTELDLHSGNSLKQQYAGSHVTPLGHIILIPSHSSLCSKRTLSSLQNLTCSSHDIAAKKMSTGR
jgi:hypothetical protein